MVKFSIMNGNQKCNAKSVYKTNDNGNPKSNNHGEPQSNDHGEPQSNDHGEPKAKCREDQTSLDCRLVRAFVAQPIKDTPVPNHLLQRQRVIGRTRENRHANITGQGLDPPGS